jgi:hypothetical protein
VAPIPESTCDDATSDAHFFEVAWFSGYAAYAERGEQVPDFQWSTGQTALPRFLRGESKARAALMAVGVPGTFPVYRDLSDLYNAIRQGIAVTKARDDSKVLEVYFNAKTADDHLVESCGALER